MPSPTCSEVLATLNTSHRRGRNVAHDPVLRYNPIEAETRLGDGAGHRDRGQDGVEVCCEAAGGGEKGYSQKGGLTRSLKSLEL